MLRGTLGYLNCFVPGEFPPNWGNTPAAVEPTVRCQLLISQLSTCKPHCPDSPFCLSLKRPSSRPASSPTTCQSEYDPFPTLFLTYNNQQHIPILRSISKNLPIISLNRTFYFDLRAEKHLCGASNFQSNAFLLSITLNESLTGF